MNFERFGDTRVAGEKESLQNSMRLLLTYNNNNNNNESSKTLLIVNNNADQSRVWYYVADNISFFFLDPSSVKTSQRFGRRGRETVARCR